MRNSCIAVFLQFLSLLQVIYCNVIETAKEAHGSSITYVTLMGNEYTTQGDSSSIGTSTSIGAIAGGITGFILLCCCCYCCCCRKGKVESQGFVVQQPQPQIPPNIIIQHVNPPATSPPPPAIVQHIHSNPAPLPPTVIHHGPPYQSQQTLPPGYETTPQDWNPQPPMYQQNPQAPMNQQHPHAPMNEQYPSAPPNYGTY